MFNVLMTQEQKDLKQLCDDFCRKEIIPYAAEWDVKGEFPMETYRKAFEIGLTSIAIPEEFGGLGMGRMEESIVYEALGYGDSGFAVSAGATGLGMTPVYLSKNEEMKALASEIVINGGFAAFCLTEPAAGSDAGSLITKVREEEDAYVINGSKCFITNGGLADVYTVFASFDQSLGTKGIAAFLVERTRPGVSVGAEENKMGIRASNTTTVNFDEVRIPKDHMLAPAGKGFRLAMETLDRTRPSGMANAVGIMQRALDLSVEYAKTRTTFGKPIIRNQGISFMLADMEMLTQASRSMVYTACLQLDKGVADPGFGACVKAFVGDAVMKVTTDAVQIFGGYGYSREYPVEKLMRDAKIWQIFEGTAQIQRLTIAAQLERR